MSLRVMIIPEDPRLDTYIVQPVVQALLSELDRPAHAETVRNPQVQGIEDAIAKTPGIVARYPQYDVFILVLDRDGNAGRTERMVALRDKVLHEVAPPRPLLWCLAEQEVEAWLLAAQWGACRKAFPDWQWADVRAAVDAKERYFQRFFAQHRDLRLPGQGRGRLMEGLDIAAVAAKCPELQRLKDELGILLERR